MHGEPPLLPDASELNVKLNALTANSTTQKSLAAISNSVTQSMSPMVDLERVARDASTLTLSMHILPTLGNVMGAQAGAGRNMPAANVADLQNLAEPEKLRHKFSVAGRHYLIAYTAASAIEDMSTIHRLPNVPAWLVGIANLKGVVVPVFDIASYLSVERPKNQRLMLLTVGKGDEAAALIIDGTSSLVFIGQCQTLPNVEATGPMKDFVNEVWLVDDVPCYDFLVFDWLRSISTEIPR